MNANIRVLHVFDKIGMKGSPIHGGTSMLMTWWPEFHEAGCELHLCVFRARSEGSEILEGKGIYAEYIDKSKFDPRILLDLARLTKKRNIQVLHCHGYSASNFGRVVGLLYKIPVVLHEHMVDSRVPWYQKIADMLLSKTFKYGIAVSNAVRDFMCDSRFMNLDKIKVIYNGIPENYIQDISQTDQEQIAAHYNIPAKVSLVGIIGRLNLIKGHSDFLDAAKLVLEKKQNTYFLIIGEGELRQDLISKAQALGIDKNILFLGHCDEVLKIISILDVLTICSHSEGCPMTVLEGMAMSKAIAATSVGGIPEMLEHKKTGILVPPKSPKEMSEAIINLLINEKLAMKLGEQAYSKVKEDFLLSHTVKQIQNIYEELVK